MMRAVYELFTTYGIFQAINFVKKKTELQGITTLIVFYCFVFLIEQWQANPNRRINSFRCVHPNEAPAKWNYETSSIYRRTQKPSDVRSSNLGQPHLHPVQTNRRDLNAYRKGHTSYRIFEGLRLRESNTLPCEFGPRHKCMEFPSFQSKNSSNGSCCTQFEISYHIEQDN